MKYCLQIIVLIGCALLFACNNDSEPLDVADVQGTWTGTVTFTSCDPASVCAETGFSAGLTRNATLTLNQDRNVLEGTYTYDGAGINAPVEGRTGSNVVSINGLATTTAGSITVNISGTVSSNIMQVNITHQVNLNDSRAANVTGTATFTR